ALCLLALFVLVARATTVTAVIDPPEISMGDSAQLTVTISGAEGSPAVQRVDGLEIRQVGTQTQFQIINGATSVSCSVTYTITPQREGTFTIPAIRAGATESKPITLHVVKGNPSANAQNNPNNQTVYGVPRYSTPQPQSQGQQPQQDQPVTDSAGRYGALQ